VFLVDKNQQIFMFRSFRAGWMAKRINEFKAAHDILVGYDLDSEAVMEECQDGLRGPHMPIIIGHHHQSAQVSYSEISELNSPI
jgi:hypothetical protein